MNAHRWLVGKKIGIPTRTRSPIDRQKLWALQTRSTGMMVGGLDAWHETPICL